MNSRLSYWQIMDKAGQLREQLRGLPDNDRMEIIGRALLDLVRDDVNYQSCGNAQWNLTFEVKK